MKKLLFLFLLSNLAFGKPSNAQAIVTREGFAFTRLNDFVEMLDKRYIPRYDKTYVIGDKRVLGTPFLFDEWQSGVLMTSDGRTFNGYKLKYDAYYQAVHFSDGKDSLEVNEPIKEFTLVTAQDDSLVKVRFVNANLFSKPKKPLFYEMLFENEKMCLLKYNKKAIVNLSQSLPNKEEKENFELQLFYFYTAKGSNKLQNLKDGESLLAMLNLDEETLKAVRSQAFDFNKEADFVKLLQFVDKQSKK
jgi:hypothetical protein